MPLIRPLDPTFPIDRQLALDATDITLLIVFTMDGCDEQAFLAAWRTDDEVLRQQPGFVASHLHRAIGDRPMYMNHAQWETTAHLRAAFAHPGHQAAASLYPASTIGRPHLFRTVAVRGISGQ